MSRALDAIIGETPVMIGLRDLVRRVAPARVPVLIEGPTGAGKELVAVALHEESGRRGKFVPFNVCAIPEAMFEDALFGHVRGAFTSAIADTTGYLREADGGTVFFDEIGGLPPLLQIKLLRAIETGHFRAVGAGRDVRSDFRIVAATNERARDLVADGRLRPDLAHRITGIKVVVPSLAERVEDIPLLAQHIAAGVGAAAALDGETFEALRAHTWPGNVRELRNVVESAVALGLSSSVVRALLTSDDTGASEANGDRRSLLAVLEAHRWNVNSAARTLGVANTTIYRRMKREGIAPPPAA